MRSAALLRLAAAALLVRGLAVPLRGAARAARTRGGHRLCRGLGSFGSGGAGRTAARLIGGCAILLRGFILVILARGTALAAGLTVSYTHLDVYKRQVTMFSNIAVLVT